MNIKDFKNRFEQIEEIDIDETDINDLQEKVWKLEEELQNAIDFTIPTQLPKFKKLMRKIAEFKKENGFFDPNSELENMFPDGQDDD